ncbi:MAG: hypothetical protein HY663_06445 [Chloroflexi bacterium]|nr:hypothetical protein [Chloroflexota bacterium]
MNTIRVLSIVALVGLLVLTFGLPARAVSASELVTDVRFDGGVVNKVFLMEDGTGKVIVDWTKFIITPDTRIDEANGTLVPYVTVDVRAMRHHGMLIATRITVLAEAPDTVIFDGGKVYAVDLTAYRVTVDGTKFITTADTELPEGLMKGDIVKVEAVRMDGKLIATKISLIN